MKDARARMKAETQKKGQDRWTSEETDRWTTRLIPNISIWPFRKHGDTDFILTQLLTEHEQFNAYLFKMGLHRTLTCKYCPDEIDDAEHTFFECVRWKDYRSSTGEITGTTLSPESLIVCMLRKEDNWSAVAA
ncbi:uncharacterized protein LOC141535933 [Cotesia typhae]|uniref:uncharacterized protein LOC141535933 n=1 Tax=Cotesia typhae TaxID=2053667 RepID=UPI003D68915D